MASVESQNIEDELDDGPPPGWKPIPQIKEEEAEDEVGPPSGSQSISVKEEVNGTPPGLDSIPVKEEDEEEGPPPGWESLPVKVEEEPGGQWTRLSDEKGPKPRRQSVPENEEDGAPPGWKSELVRDGAVGDMRPPGRQSAAPPKQRPPILASQPRTPPPRPPPPAVSSEKAQMVCGSCHQLLSYPRGSKYVQCSCCRTVNLVLEEHQVGLVKCGSCAVLLMYPYGAESVKCSSCRIVTEIGVHNKRPPLSVQQGRPPPLPNPVH